MSFVPRWDKCRFMKLLLLLKDKKVLPYKDTAVECVTIQEDSSEGLNTESRFEYRILGCCYFQELYFSSWRALYAEIESCTISRSFTYIQRVEGRGRRAAETKRAFGN